jgi:hypothetical protein
MSGMNLRLLVSTDTNKICCFIIDATSVKGNSMLAAKRETIVGYRERHYPKSARKWNNIHLRYEFKIHLCFQSITKFVVTTTPAPLAKC